MYHVSVSFIILCHIFLCCLHLAEWLMGSTLSVVCEGVLYLRQTFVWCVLCITFVQQSLELLGSAESPEVILDTEGVLFFKQTCIGTSSQRTYTIKNVSRIPLRYLHYIASLDIKLIFLRFGIDVVVTSEIKNIFKLAMIP